MDNASVEEAVLLVTPTAPHRDSCDGEGVAVAAIPTQRPDSTPLPDAENEEGGDGDRAAAAGSGAEGPRDEDTAAGQAAKSSRPTPRQGASSSFGPSTPTPRAGSSASAPLAPLSVVGGKGGGTATTPTHPRAMAPSPAASVPSAAATPAKASELTPPTAASNGSGHLQLNIGDHNANVNAHHHHHHAPAATSAPAAASPRPISRAAAATPAPTPTRPPSRSNFFAAANEATLNAVASSVAYTATAGGGGGGQSPRGGGGGGHTHGSQSHSGEAGHDPSSSAVLSARSDIASTTNGVTASADANGHHHFHHAVAAAAKGEGEGTYHSQNTLNSAQSAANSPSSQDVGRWVAGGRYMRYDIDRPQTTPSSATLRAGRAGGSAGGSRAVVSGESSAATTDTTSPSRSPARIFASEGGAGGIANYTVGGDPNSKRRFNTIGVGIMLSASRGGGGGGGGGGAGASPLASSAIAGGGDHNAGAADEAGPRENNSIQINSNPIVAAAAGGGEKEVTVAAARARLLSRRDQLQASLDARGSTYTNKIGKLTSTWLYGDKRSMVRKAATPPRNRPVSPEAAAASITASPSRGPSRLGGSTNASGALPQRVGSPDTSLSSPFVRNGGESGHSSLANTSRSVAGAAAGGEGGGGEDGTTMPPTAIRQHLAASFAAVHLSPNSSTVVVHSPEQSPRGSPRRSPRANNSSTTTNNNSLNSTANGQTVRSLLSASASSVKAAGGGGGGQGEGYYNNHGYIKGMDIGLEKPAVALKRSTSPPLGPLHGGSTHNEQQQARLFPALMGPYANPYYYTRKGDGKAGYGRITTRSQLQAQRDNRPVSPLRHGNALGVPTVSRPYSPDHDLQLDSPFRVCGSASHRPMPRQRPAAGPPQFLSPGTTSAAKRTYISGNPNAYQ